MNFDPAKIVNFLNANIFVDIYNRFLGIFPNSVHWLVSLAILIAIAITLFKLIMRNWLFLIFALFFFPVLYPVLKNFFGELYTFLLYLWASVSAGLPKG